MGINFRALPTKCVKELLTHLGFSYDRTKGSHDQWVRKGRRTIPIRGSEKQVPAIHLKTICKNTDFSIEDIYKWANKNC